MDENSTTAFMGAAPMAVCMCARPDIFGANTPRHCAWVMFATVASCSTPPACTKPRSTSSPCTKLPASSQLDESQRFADTQAELSHSRRSAASWADTRPLRPSSHSGADSLEAIHSAIISPRAPSPPDSTYSPPSLEGWH